MGCRQKEDPICALPVRSHCDRAREREQWEILWPLHPFQQLWRNKACSCFAREGMAPCLVKGLVESSWNVTTGPHAGTETLTRCFQSWGRKSIVDDNIVMSLMMNFKATFCSFLIFLILCLYTRHCFAFYFCILSFQKTELFF